MCRIYFTFYLNKEGRDKHDHNLWAARERQLGRKPYLEGIAPDVYNGTSDAAARLETLLNTTGLGEIMVDATRNRFSNMNINMSRIDDVKALVYNNSDDITRYEDYYTREESTPI